MRPADDYILELLLKASQVDIEPNPSTIAHNIDYDNSYVSQRLGELKKSELVIRKDKSYWRISDKGREYLEGQLDADGLGRDDATG